MAVSAHVVGRTPYDPIAPLKWNRASRVVRVTIDFTEYDALGAPNTEPDGRTTSDDSAIAGSRRVSRLNACITPTAAPEKPVDVVCPTGSTVCITGNRSSISVN